MAETREDEPITYLSICASKVRYFSMPVLAITEATLSAMIRISMSDAPRLETISEKNEQ